MKVLVAAHLGDFGAALVSLLHLAPHNVDELDPRPKKDETSADGSRVAAKGILQELL